MDDQSETRAAVLVNVVDADGNIIAEQVMDYEVPDFLRLRVDPEIAKGCCSRTDTLNVTMLSGRK